MMRIILLLSSCLIFLLFESGMVESRALDTRATGVRRASATTPVDCDFDRSMCGWRKLRNRKQRRSANLWKLSQKIKRTAIRDMTAEDGKFALFRPRHRSQEPSVLKSKFFTVPRQLNEACINFYSAIGESGSKHASLTSLSKLKVYVVPKSGKMKRSNLVWTSDQMSVTDHFQHITIQINKRQLLPKNKTKFRVYFEAIRGESSKAFVAVDGIKLRHCGPADETQPQKSPQGPSVTPTPVSRTIMLPARRNPSVVSEVGMYGVQNNPSYNMGLDNYQWQATHKEKLRNFLSQNLGLPTRAPVATTTSRQEVCGMLEYTTKLNACLRSFFVDLSSVPNQCSNLYRELERCVQDSAISCVPSSQLSAQEVNNTVTGALRQSFKTKQVYCEEEGAFVYPEFTLSELPQCGGNYFGRVAQCSETFRTSFQTEHGLDLCTEYYKANECQRIVTAQECTLGLRDMLLFGLQLQYQFAHNPFCQEVPVSVWWPAHSTTRLTT